MIDVSMINPWPATQRLTTTVLTKLAAAIEELQGGIPNPAVAETLTASAALDVSTYYTVDASAASGTITLTLPDAATCSGLSCYVRKSDATRNRFNVTAAAGQLINGLSTRAVRAPNEILTLVSDGTGWRAQSSRDEPVLGGWNLEAGLARFRQMLGKCGRDMVTSTGLGGVDIVSYGDSIAEGGMASSYLFDVWHHRLKLRLQARYNPVGVTGGYGLVRVAAGTTSTAWPGTTDGANYGLETVATNRMPMRLFNASGAAVNAPDGTNTQGGYHGTTGVRAAIANGFRLMFAFDGTDALAAQKRLAADRLQLLTENSSADNYGRVATWDIITDQASGYTPVTAGTGAQTGSFTPAKETNKQYAARYDLALAVTPGARNLLQLTGPAGVWAWVEGVIAYNGDYDCGIRGPHNCAGWGSRAVEYIARDGMLAGIDVWGSGAGSTDANSHTRGGAVNAGLFMADWISNDSKTDTVAAFKAAYATFVERCLACATKPSVLLWIPPQSDNVTTPTNYAAYKRAIYEIAETHDDVAVFDFDVYLGGMSQYGTLAAGKRVFDLGWNADGIHYSSTAASAWADVFYRVITGEG